MNLKKIKDAYEEESITRDDVAKLYRTGKLKVDIPKDVLPDEFAKRCLERIEDLLFDPETNYHEDLPKLTYIISGDAVLITAMKGE